MIFRQLLDPRSWTYTYLLACPRSKEAVLIDPVFEQHERDAALVRELGLTLAMSLDTHVHADHVTGAWMARERLGARIGVSARAGAEGVDVPLHDGQELRFGECALQVRHTPGHTSGCATFVVHREFCAFTGDALLIRGAGRTDFQQGDPGLLFRSIREQILSLPDETLVYPAHDYAGRTVTTVAEEKRFNPRVGGDVREADFVDYMNNLGLAHPKQIDQAVPANLRCGRPEGEIASVRSPDWGPAARSFAGVVEIDLPWAAEHLGELTVLDVRRPDELRGDLGHIPEATCIPLEELAGRTDEVPRAKPVVVVCRSGARSARATLMLDKAGFDRVANLGGGMIHWSHLGLPVIRP